MLDAKRGQLHASLFDPLAIAHVDQADPQRD
jgi:hypothetical protein